MKLRNTAANKQQPSIAMGEYNGVAHVDINEGPSSPKLDNFKKVSVLHLIFLIFYEVSGGPFGVEDSVQAAGPLLSLLGFLVFPLIWSVPEALITAEMGTMFPENGGYVVWVSTALGPYWGFQQGWMKWLSGVIDNALYPVLFLDYLKSGIPALAGGLPRVAAALALTVLLTYMNYRGLAIVGWVAVLLGIFSILPFVVMGLVAIPKLEPSRWFVMNLHDVDWNLYLNTLFWNLNYWDSISTLAGEVDNPKKNLPKALFYALILVVLSYFLPLLVGTGAIPLNRDLWTDGYFSDIAKILGGVWLRWWIQGAAAMSNMGMFVAEMSSDSFQLLGMAERGMLPEFFAKRSRHGTPLIGILFSASGVILLSWLSFQEIIAAENFLYCFGMILEFIAFVLLRIKCPVASRPYKIPVGTVGAILMCIPPTILICVVLALSTVKVMIVSLFAVAIGLVMQPCLKYAEKKRWMKFSVSGELPDLHEEKYKRYGDEEMYFFTPRNRKYRNGSRPNRAADGGYWKATGKDKTVKYRGTPVGKRKTLEFYTGKALQGEKTDWKMHEFTVNDPAPIHQVRNTRDYMRIYKKSKKPKDVRNRQRDEENSTLTAMDNVDDVNNHDEDRTDLPVMDAGYVGEMDNVGADAVFTHDYSQQQIASSEFPADFNLHAASYSSMFPSLAETCGDPASVFSNSDNLSTLDDLLNPANFHWNTDDPFFDLHTSLPINIPGNPVPAPGNLANPASPCNLPAANHVPSSRYLPSAYLAPPGHQILQPVSQLQQQMLCQKTACSNE